MAHSASSTPSNSTTNNLVWTASNMSSASNSPMFASPYLDGITQHATETSTSTQVDIITMPASIGFDNSSNSSNDAGTPALFDSFNADISSAPVSTNTIAPQDFCLYERMDPSAFDFPLFGETFKQQKQKQTGAFQNQLADEELSLALELQHQQQMEQMRYVQSHSMPTPPQAIVSDGLPAVAASLCDMPLFPEDLALSASLPASASTSSNRVSYGFDSLSALMDDSVFDLGRVAYAMSLQPQIPLHQNQEQTRVYYANVADTPLLDGPSTPYLNSPFSPALDTPAMTDLAFRHVSDYGCSGQTPLFGSAESAFPFHLPLPIQLQHGLMATSGCDMVAPHSTLLVAASPDLSAPPTFGAFGRLGDIETDLIRHIKMKKTSDSVSLSLSEISSALSSPLYSDDDDMALKDEQDDEDMDPHETESSACRTTSGNGNGDWDDRHQTTSSSSASTVVSFVYSGRRKAKDAAHPALLSGRRMTPLALDRHPSVSGDNDSEIDTDDHHADASYIPVATFVHSHKRKSKAGLAPPSISKRTRPTLASPFGGKKEPEPSSSISPKLFVDMETVSSSSSLPIEQGSGNQPSDNHYPIDQSPNKRLQLSTKRRSVKKDTGGRRFACEHPGCGRTFTRLYNMHSHERTHNPAAARPFACDGPNCDRSFTRKHDLQRHQNSVHLGQRRFRCDTCAKMFSRLDGLRRHYGKPNLCVPNPNSQQSGIQAGDYPADDADGVNDEDDSSDESDTETMHSAT
ncbi:hypothetical protein BGZ95_008997 [Linnemannia exigua]|uniref:C2H2-type domain-containing protein n=1 Tax=Linnemannia exigua TaxID=604196 RepID=A0AAD4HAJ6_9FUNG|nr:hypothetical protein BGZ95_008997 [Linnemannia exigua]